MSYEEMSDNQIDRLVSKQLKSDEGLDYCNSWTNAGPIIEENGISLISYEGETMAVVNGLFSVELGLDNSLNNVGLDIREDTLFVPFDKNPLKAAMICFLKMKDAKNGSS